MPVEVEQAAVEHAHAYLEAIKSGTDTAAKGMILDTAASTIAGFIGGSGDDVATAKKLSQAEVYWHFANHHPWIGAATELIAKTIAGAGFDIVAPGNDRDQDAVEKDPAVQALRVWLGAVNDEQTIEDLVEELSLDADIVGYFFVHVLRLGKKIVGLERLDSRTTAPVLSEDGRSLAKFVQKTRVRGQVITTTFKPDDVIFGKRAGGADILGRGSPIEQLDLTIGVDWSARKAAMARFQNGVRAGVILVNSKLDAKQLALNTKTLEQHKAGTENTGKPLSLAGEWDVYFPPGGDDEEFGKSMDRARQEVCATYHIPEAKLITTEGALGGNGKEADDQTFHEECIRPRARAIWRTLSRRIIKEFVAAGAASLAGLELRPKTKYSIRVSMIPMAVQGLQAGLTVNETRGLMDAPVSAKKKLDLDMPLVAGLLKSAENVVAPPPPPMAPPAAPKPAGDQPAKKAGARAGGHTEALAAFEAEHLRAIDSAAPRLTKKLLAGRKAMIAAFADASGLDVARKSAELAPTGDEPIGPHEIDRIRRAIKDLDAGDIGAAIAELGEDVYRLSWSNARVLLDMHANFDEPPSAEIERLRKDANAFSFLVAERERVVLRELLTSALEDGDSTETLASAIRVSFADGFHVDPSGDELRQTGTGRVIGADAWSEMVARTELSRAANAGLVDFYEAAGLEKVRWIGSDPCDLCAQYDDEVFALDEIPDDGPPLHPNCCCALAPVNDDLEQFRGTAEDRAAAARGNNPDDSEE